MNKGYIFTLMLICIWGGIQVTNSADETSTTKSITDDGSTETKAATYQPPDLGSTEETIGGATRGLGDILCRLVATNDGGSPCPSSSPPSTQSSQPATVTSH